MSENPEEMMDYLALRYMLKGGSVKEPDTYLGVQIKKCQIPGLDGPTKTRWVML
jgi:hypothetical protein